LSNFFSEHQTDPATPQLCFASTQASRSRHLSFDLLELSAPIPAGILPRVLRPKPGNRPSIFRSSTRVTAVLDRLAPSLPEPPLDLHGRRLNSVNTVKLCNLALVDVPKRQSPRLVARPPGPSVQAQHPSFTAPGPSAQTRMTFTFAADHRLRLPRLRTTSQEAHCTTRLTPWLVHKLNLTCSIIDNHSSSNSNHKGTYPPCVRTISTFSISSFNLILYMAIYRELSRQKMTVPFWACTSRFRYDCGYIQIFC